MSAAQKQGKKPFDDRLLSVEKKTLQKRRAITIFYQFRLLGNGV